MGRKLTIDDHGLSGRTDAAGQFVEKGVIAVWAMAIRPKTLVLSVVPVMAGSYWAWIAQASVRFEVMLLALVAAAAIQIGTNLWNDLKDGVRGDDTAERIGPPRIAALGLAAPRTIRNAAALAFAAAIACGLHLALIGGWPIVAIGIASLLCGLAYSAGPRPIAYTPLGELFVLVFFGIIAVAGTFYLHTGSVSASAIGLGAVLGLPAAAVLLVNNHRDRRSDRQAGRRTLAILIGPEWTRRLYGSVLLLSVAAATAFMRPDRVLDWAILLGLTGAALALADGFRNQAISPRLNAYLGRTGGFQLLLAIGIAVMAR